MKNHMLGEEKMKNEKENTMVPAQPSAFKGETGAVPPEILVPGEDSRSKTVAASDRAEIDTSAPFESVKQAVNLFGGSAVWNSQLRQLFLPNKPHCVEEFELINLEDQTAQLGKDLVVKEWETLDVLKELERTKIIMDELKLQLQKEASEVNSMSGAQSSGLKFHPHVEGIISVSDSGTVLDDLKQAKMNLSRTTCDLSKIHAFTESVYRQIDCERTLVKKTPEKLIAGRAAEQANDKRNLDPAKISREIEHLKSKIEEFRQTAAAAKSEASKLTFEIEQMQAGIKNAEIRLFAVKKMEEAARAAEAVALVKIEVVLSSNNPNVVLPFEEHATHKAQEIDESTREQIVCEIGRGYMSKLELLAKVDEASAEVKTSRKVLEDALNRLEAANSCNQKWLYDSAKFKNSYPAGTNHALSIGEILCKKLMGLEEHENSIATSWTQNENAEITLGQILNRRPVVLPPQLGGGLSCKQQAVKRKRKKFGFVGLSQLLKQESKKIKNKKRRVLIQLD